MTTLVYIEPHNQKVTGPTSFMTEKNDHEVLCGMCGRTVYVAEATYRFASDAIKAGLDNPFRCEVCDEEYDDLAYEG